MPRLSRRKIADYAAGQLLDGNADVLREVAALLIEERREKEAELLARDIEDALLARGVAIADTTSAHTLDARTRSALEKFIRDQTGASTVHLRESVDESVIGGVRLALPGKEMDATVQRKLTKLKASKV